MKESKFTAWFMSEMEKVNCFHFALVASEMQKPGLPDRYVAGKGLPGCWLEFKAARGALREDQKQVLRKFDEHGVPNLVVREIAGFIRFEDRLGDVHGILKLPLERDQPAGVQLRAAIIAALGVKRCSTSL